MPGLDYPFVYECSNCEQETSVKRRDARGLYPDPDSPNAVKVVLQERGWPQRARHDAETIQSILDGDILI